MKLVLFDVDGTLLDGPSSERAFAAYLYKRGLLGPKQMLAWIRFFFRYLSSYGFEVIKRNKAYLAGMDFESVCAWAREFVQNELVHSLNPELLSKLRLHIQAGDRVMLLTGTPDFIARPLAESLGVDQFVAAQLAVCDGKFQNSVLPFHPYGAEKLRIARELCVIFQTTLEDVVAYADSRSDLDLLSAVGRPVAVNADHSLSAFAQRAGWEQILRSGFSS